MHCILISVKGIQERSQLQIWRVEVVADGPHAGISDQEVDALRVRRLNLLGRRLRMSVHAGVEALCCQRAAYCCYCS